MTTTATTTSIEQPTDQHHHSTGRGSTRTARQRTICSHHISWREADIGFAQSTSHSTGYESEQALSAKRCTECTTPHRDATHTHTDDEHLSVRSDAHALDGTRRGQRVRARAAQGGKEKERDRMTCSDYHRNEEWVAARDGAPVLLCWRRSPGEHEPVGHLQKARGYQHECELGPTNPSLAHRCVTGRCFNTRSGEEARRSARRVCAGAAAAEKEKRTAQRYV